MPSTTEKIIVKSVLFELAKILKKIYPLADIDYPDSNLLDSNELKKLYTNVNFGKNVSPEGLGKGFSHSLTMKFSKSVDRDSIYLPHPIHKKFSDLFVPFTNSVLVYDFWE